MIPILYASDEKEFQSQGLGALTDAISCSVTEERNGIYELEMEYPQTGIRYADIVAGNIVFAIPSPYRSGQPFRIYKVTKPLAGNVMVYANHISYDLNKIPVKPFSAGTAADAMSAIEENCAIANDFLLATDKNTAANMKIDTPTAARSCLGGIQGSVLDTYGGEYEWDRFTVYLRNQRGTDSGVVIRYGKNLTGLTQEGDVSNLVTGIFPYWYSDDVLVTCDPQIIYAEGATGQTAIPVDLTDRFEEQPTAAQLKSAAESYIKANNIGVPEVSLTTEFLNLSQMSGYEEMQLLEKCDLCDTVTVQYEQAGIDAKAKIVSIKTDVLLERYEQIEVGSIRPNIAQTIANQQTQIDQTATPSVLQQYINSATSWITGGRGGYVIFQKNADGQPDEILIMDTPDINTATKVWRWNQGGLGYSKNGYSGPYATAITQDGKIVADFITAGTMLANIIKGGTLTLGGSGNGNGVCNVLNAAGKTVVSLSNEGCVINGGKLDLDNVAQWFAGVRVSDGNEATASVVPGGVWAYNVYNDYSAIEPGGVHAGTMSGATPEGGFSPKVMLHSNGSIVSTYAYEHTDSGSPNVVVWSNGLFLRSASSSKRYKEEITEQIPERLDPHKLYALPVKSFKYKPGYLMDSDTYNGKKRIGLIVEDVADIYPDAVNYDASGQPEMWNSQILIPAMLRLIQEQNERLKKLEEALKK